MAFNLVCLSAVADHVKGDIITDAETVKRYLASDFAHHFVKHVAPEPPAAEPAKADPPAA